MANQQDIEIKEKLKGLVENFTFVDWVPQSDKLEVSSLNEVVKHFKQELVTTKLVSNIISDITFEAILHSKHFENGKNGEKKFSDWPGVNVDQAVEEIYSLLNELPKKYTFILRLPNSKVKIPNVKISENIEIFTLDNTELIKYVPEDSKKNLLSSLTTDRIALNENDVVLRINGSGFVGKYGLIKAYIVDPLHTMKVAVGIYLALGAMQAGKSYTPWGFPSPYSFYVYDDSNNKLIRTINESTDDNNYVRRMEFVAEIFEKTELEKLTKKETTKFQDITAIISKLYINEGDLAKETSSESKNFQTIIKNAAYWYYETLKTPEEHIRTVYLTTAFDSLLGAIENEKEVIKEMKAEIIANLTANNALEANRIKTTIKKLYKLRNDIIHGKKTISALEQYSENLDGDYIVRLSLWYFGRFFSNRIYFMTNGIQKKK